MCAMRYATVDDTVTLTITYKFATPEPPTDKFLPVRLPLTSVTS